MDKSTLKEYLKKIRVINLPDADVEVVNESPLTMIGKGRQGAIFRVSDHACVKVFGNNEDCDREHYALSLGQHTNLFPHVFEKGANYIVMEFVTGVDLREYLQSQPLTRELSYKLIKMLTIFKEVGFERIDHHKRQIYVQPDGELKVIDVGRTVWRDRVYPYPRKLLNSLGDENRAIFLSHVQEMDPELYREWQEYMKLEEMAHEVYMRFLAKPVDFKSTDVKSFTKILQTMNPEAGKSDKHIAGLLYKVFKEEWIRLTQDPDNLKEMAGKYDSRKPIADSRTETLLKQLSSREQQLRNREQQLRSLEDEHQSDTEKQSIREERHRIRIERKKVQEQIASIRGSKEDRIKSADSAKSSNSTQRRSYPTIDLKPLWGGNSRNSSPKRRKGH